MSETTKHERDRMRGLIGHGINENGTAAKCLRDADRLAQAEALLSAAKCPDCDGSGVVVHSVTRPYPECCGNFLDSGECCGEPVAVPVEEGEPGPCQWCHEREGLLWGTGRPSDD